MSEGRLVLGVDFGTDSVRVLLADCRNGQELSSAIVAFPRWKKGLYCDPARFRFRQHPLDYIESLETAIRQCVSTAGPQLAKQIVALSIDTTGSTPVAVNAQGTPLALLPEFAEEPDAMFHLWKDHSAQAAAQAINDHARHYPVDYLRYAGGIYSSEWFWSKLLHTLRTNPALRPHIYSWVEHADWMPFLLTGGTNVHHMKRNVCTAGHKALWSNDWNGLPPENFWNELDPLLTGFRDRLYHEVADASTAAGRLSPEWADKLGLSTNVLVGVGAMDAHMAAVGGQIEPFQLCKVMGTSTCDMLVAPAAQYRHAHVQGICGLVESSVIPQMIGMEAGQSAFGDIYAWFAQLLAWPLQHFPGISINIDDHSQIIPALAAAAAQLPVTDEDPLSVDWFNGRRTPDANALLKGAITGLHLGSSAPHVFRSLVEASCFGARAIIERFRDENVPVNGLTGVGGIARKSPYIMQMMADICELPLKINRAEQTGALGAAMFAATVAKQYPKVEEAMTAMGQGFETTYYPDPAKEDHYRKRYRRYQALGGFLEKKPESLLTSLSAT